MMLEPDYEPGKDPVIDGLVKREQGRTAFKGAVTQGVKMNPDEYAKAVKLSLSTGVVPDVVLKDMQGFEQEAKVNALAGLQDTHPKTAAFLTQNAELAHDDVDTLKGVESSIRTIPQSALGSWIQGSNRVGKGLTTDLQRLFQGMGRMYDIFLPESVRKKVEATRAADEVARQKIDAEWFDTGKAMGQRMINPDNWIVNSIVGTAPDMAIAWATAGLGPAIQGGTKAHAAGNLVTRLGAYLTERAPQIALQTATSFPSVLTSEADEYQQVNPKASRVEAVGKAAISAVAQSILEGLVEVPVIERMQKAQSVTKRLTSLFASAQMEGAEEVAQRLTSQWLLPDPSGTRKLTAQDLWENYRGGVAAGAFFGAGSIVAPKISADQRFYQALADGAKDSKLLKRMPEKYQEAVQSMVKDGPVEHLRIAPEAFETFYQSKGIDPAAKAAELGVKNYMEARLSGNDLLIPTAAYATQVAGSEDHAELSKDLRLVEGAMTAREREASAQGGEQLAAMAQEVDAETQAKPEFQAIKEDLKARYIAAGETAAVAETYAMDGAKVFQNMARQAGMNPSELFAQYAPKIVRGDAPKPADVVQEAFTPETFPAEGVSWADQESMYWQSAYHGSPYRFDKFSLDHMGKGEGAQAYGWGLYFAGSKEVGEWYKNTTGARKTINGEPASLVRPDHYAALQVETLGGDKEAAAAIFRHNIERYERTGNEQGAARNREALRVVESGELPKIEHHTGQVYQVEIPDDGAYLLWDKPLSEQPEAVKNAIENLVDGVEVKDDHIERGKKVLTVKGKFQGYAPEGSFDAMGGDRIYALIGRLTGSEENASKALHSLGIAGIKYLDGSSRGAGEGNYNYVVFDDKAVQITKTFYQSGFKKSYGTVESIPRGVHFDDLSPETQNLVVSGIEKDIQAWVDNPEEFKRQYREHEDTKGGKLVNGDIINYMMPTVSGNVTLGLSAMKGVDSALQMQVITLHKQLRQQSYDLAGDKPVGITAGGQASGKTSLAEWVLRDDISGAVIDAPHDDAKTVERYIAEIKALGKDAQVFYVDRTDFSAVYRSMLVRATKEGRMVPLGDMISKHLKVPTEMLKVAESNRNSHRVSLYHAIAGENVQPEIIGGPLSDSGKDAALSIRDRVAPTESELAQIARETYISYLKDAANGKPGTPELSPDLKREIESSFPGGMVEDSRGAGIIPGDTGKERGQASDLQSGVSDPLYQSRPLDERSFGSKQWNEYYRNQVGKNARAKGDRAKRAEAGMKAANSEQGQAAFDFERNQEAKAEQEAFLNFDRAMSRVVQPRGWFSRGADGSFVIGKTPEGDFSTFIHEPAHAYLEMFSDLYQREGASERLKEDGAKILKFLEVDSFDKITTLEHEKWARANEAYAREGKAPSEELRPVFQRFKVWLQSVYRYVSELDVELNDDIRGVFDRMRATDQEIELAHQAVAGPQLFASAEEAGWTDKEFKAYAIEKDMSIEEAKAEVLKKMNEAALREKTQEWKREEAEVRDAVTALVDERPEFRAIRTLRKGTMEDGTPVTLNREALVQQFGEDRVKALQAQHINLYRKEGGVDAQTAAELLGFESGDVLMEVLENTGKRKDAIAEATRAVMTQQHGDIRYNGTLEDQARQAVANDSRTKALHRELSALRNKVNKATEAKADAKAARAAVVIPPVQTFREAAISIVEAKPIMDLEPNAYLNGQRKNSREAFKLNGQGKFQEAADAKQKELLNHFLYLESVKAKAESEKIATYGKRLAGTPAQERIGKAQGGYLEQINAMLERFDFAKVTNKALREGQTLAQFAASVEQAGNGENLAIDPQLLDERYQKNYREMNIAELRAVKDALKNIETLARLENEYLADGRRETYEQIKNMFVEWTPENEKGIIHREGDKLTLLEKGGHLVRGIDAELLKVEWMVDRFDRGDPNGPMRTFIKKTIDNANGRKLDLGFEVFGKIKALADARPKEEVAREMDLTGIKFPTQPQEMTQQQLISWAFNLGTIENRNVALGGEGLILPDGSISPLVDKAMSKLSSSQWEFIQGVWDIMETLRPMIAEKQKRTTGVEPKWKENAPFSVMTSDGKTVQLRGGYYPLAADPKTTDIGKNQSDPLAVNGQGSRSRPTVASGFTKEVTGATYQLKLDYPSVLSSHLNDVITNLTCGEAVAAVNKVISDPDIRRAMEEKLGPEYVATLKPWLVDFVERAADAPRSDAVANFITRFKSGATVATLAGNAASILVQVSDIAKPLFAPGVSNLALVKARYDMTLHGKELVAQIKELSPNVMRHRAETFNREIKDTLQSWNMFDQKKRATTQFLMSAFSVMDAQITFPTWLAVYREGLKSHGNEAQAITEADAVVNRTFQAGDPANMSAMFRSRNAWMRLFTTFQNDGNTWYGLISSSVASKKIGRISMALMGAFIGQALGQIMKGRGPGDDDDKREWAMKQAMLVPVGSAPFFGDVISTGLSIKGFGGGGDFTSSMMGRTGQAFAKPFVHWDEMDWQDVAITEADALGTWMGIPGTTQALRSWKYVHKVQTGKEQPDSNAEAIKNLVLGPPPKKK